MGKTAETLDNEKLKSLPQSILTAASLLIEWVQGQIQSGELDQIECHQGINHVVAQNEDCKFGR